MLLRRGPGPDQPSGRLVRTPEPRPPYLLYALPPSILVGFAAVLLVSGLDLLRIAALIGWFVLVLGWSLVVKGLVRRAAPKDGPRVPHYPLGLWAAVVLGLLVAVSSVVAAWDHDVVARQADPTDQDAYFARLAQLTTEQTTQQQVIDSPDPVVDQDLERQYRADEVDLRNAALAVVCERDGTCGSKLVGAGPNYREKVRYRDKLQRDFDALQGQIALREAELRDELTALHAQKAAAKGALAVANEQLEELDRKRPEPPSRFWAGMLVAGDHLWAAFGLWAAATAVALLDLALAVGLVRLFWRGGRTRTDELGWRHSDDLDPGPGVT